MIKRGQSIIVPFTLWKTDGTRSYDAEPWCRVAIDEGQFANCINSPVRKQNSPVWTIELDETETDGSLIILAAYATNCHATIVPLYTEEVWTEDKAEELGEVHAVVDRIKFDANNNVITTPYVDDAAVDYTDVLILNGEPLADADVWATSGENGAILQSTETGSDGSFTLHLNAGGKPYIHAQKLGVAEYKRWQIEYVDGQWQEVS